MGSAAVVVLVIVILVVILVAIGWLSLGFNMQFAKGQFPPNNAPPVSPSTGVPVTPATPSPVVTPVPAPVAPTIVNTPTPTAPNPNFQYLPQKAYVQAYGPEIGIPTSGGQLQGVPVVQPASVQQAAPSSDLGGGLNIASIMAILAAGGAYLKGHLANKKAEKTEVVAKENSVAIVDSKVVEQEIAKYMFNLDKAKAEALNDQPAIKLETLEDKKEKATETASKA